MLKHKRTLAGILAATMMHSMAACGGGGSQKDGDVAEGPLIQKKVRKDALFKKESKKFKKPVDKPDSA